MNLPMETELKRKLEELGAEFVHYVDVSHFSSEQNRKLPRAILLGTALQESSKEAFDAMESKTDQMADFTAEYLSDKGFSAFSQSEQNILQKNLYDAKTKRTPLPHKAVAGLAGLGWIGKHDLIVSPVYGSAFSMCTVLTDAPLKTKKQTLLDSQCGDCSICADICHLDAIKGEAWYLGISREKLVDVSICNSCFKCAAACPWTQNYLMNI
jgi:epoxyqueuosine reductase QueG